jgi:hypothetical protein
VRALHADFAWVVVAANLVVGVWGVWLWRRKRRSGRAFWIALAAAWASIYVQGLLGLTLFKRYNPPFKHHFYGFLFAIVTLAVLPMRSEPDRTRLAAFGFATLFIGIVAVRATLSL